MTDRHGGSWACVDGVADWEDGCLTCSMGQVWTTRRDGGGKGVLERTGSGEDGNGLRKTTDAVRGARTFCA